MQSNAKPLLFRPENQSRCRKQHSKILVYSLFEWQYESAQATSIDSDSLCVCVVTCVLGCRDMWGRGRMTTKSNQYNYCKLNVVSFNQMGIIGLQALSPCPNRSRPGAQRSFTKQHFFTNDKMFLWHKYLNEWIMIPKKALTIQKCANHSTEDTIKQLRVWMNERNGPP